MAWRLTTINSGSLQLWIASLWLWLSNLRPWITINSDGQWIIILIYQFRVCLQNPGVILRSHRLPLLHHQYSIIALWPNTTTFLRSQKSYLRTLATTIRCGRRPQHLKSHRVKKFLTALTPNVKLICVWLSERLFMASGHHSSLWSKATTFVGSQRGCGL